MSDLSINEKIAEYKKEHPEVKNLSREKIISIMKLEKTEPEKVYHTGEKTNAGNSFNAVNSAFGTGFGMSDDLIPRWQTKNIEPKYSKEEAAAMQFLKQMVSSADANMDYQDKHEGYISKWVVNLVKEAGNTVYAKSNVKKAISDTKSDIIVLENAASGQIDKDFTGNKLTFKEAFRTQRGVEFDEKKILNCEEKSKEMANVQLAKDITDKLKNTLDRATVNNASNTGMVDANEAIKDTLMFLGVKKQSDINNILKNIETKHRDDDVIKKYGGDFRIAKNKAGKYMIYRTAKDGYPAEATMEELQIIAKEMKFMINQAYASSINAEIPENVTPEQLEKITHKKYASHKAEYQKSFKEAYGKKDLEALSEKYMQSQQQGTAYIETGINIVSMATMFMGSGMLLKGMNYGSKALKATSFASKAEKVVELTAKATVKAEKLSGVLMANQIAQPVKFIENLTSEEADWKSYGLSAAEGTMWMALGAASGTLGDKARMVLKQKGLSGLVKNSGKSLDELMALYKSGHQLPEGLAKAFNAIDKCATITGSSLELSADLLLTYAGNKALHGEDLSMNDVLMSVNGVVIGTFMQKKISNLKNEDKVKIIKQDLLQKNPNLSKAELEKRTNAVLDLTNLIKDKKVPLEKINPQHEITTNKNDALIVKTDNTLRFTPEGEKAARNAALEIHNAAEKKESEIIEIMEKYGLGVSKKNMTHRPKSAQSIYDKIKNDMLNIKYPASFEKALKGVRDAVGTRTELEDFDYKKHPDIVEMLKTDPEKAYLMASERQSEPYVNKLKEIILAQAEGESDIYAIKISNYKGKNGISYFSDRQVAELRDLAAEHGIDLDVKDKTSKIRPSGYTALQMNFVTKDGFTFEWQLRGTGVNKFAECEHVPYDIRENKDVTGGNPRLKKLYEPLEGIVKSMTDDEMKEYNIYLTEHYVYLRKKELGFDVEPPVLNEKFDSRLSADNLEILHDIAVKVKSGEDCTELIKDFEEHLRDVPSWAERKTPQIGEFIPYVRKNDKQRFEDMKSKLLALYPEEDLLNNPLTAETYEIIFSNLQKHIGPDDYYTLLDRATILKDNGDVVSSFGLLNELSTMPESKFNAVVKYLDGKEDLDSVMLYNIVKVSSEFSPIDKNLPLLIKNGVDEVTVKNLKNLRDKLEGRLFDLAHAPEIKDDIMAFTDIVFKLEDKIQDPIVEKRVNDLIDYACTADYLAPYFKETNVLLDIVNTSKGKYNSINGELYEAYKKYVNVEAEKVKNNKNNKNLSKDEALVRAKENLMEAVEKGTQLGLNFQQDLKYEPLKKYFNECGPKGNLDFAKHLYKEYYTKDLPELVAKECENIQKEFGTAVFLTDKEDFSAANKIYHEFKIFYDTARNAGDYAIFPPTLDCSIFDVSFIDANTAGFIRHDVERIKLKGHENIGYALRHELMHGNDKEKCKNYGIFGTNKKYDFRENSSILKEKKWYRNEFANAGIPEGHIDYAYENRSEFIAVAAEGDFTKYSPEFKIVLVDLGMPEWAFDMPMNTFEYRFTKDIGE